MQKNRIISLLLTLALALSLIPVFSMRASAYPPLRPLPKLTGNQPVDVVNVALSQVGYIEDPDWSNAYGAWWNTVTDWGVDYTRQPWCAMFVCWCANQAGLGLNTGYCIDAALVEKLAAWCDTYGAYYEDDFKTTPRPGDYIFFGYSYDAFGHVAIVVDYNPVTNVVTFVGGNQSIGDGYGVRIRSCEWKPGISYGLNQKVLSYGRPNYSHVDQTLYPTGQLAPTALTEGEQLTLSGSVTCSAGIDQMEVTIQDRNGKTCYTGQKSIGNVKAVLSQVTIPFQNLPAGVYRYRLDAVRAGKKQTVSSTEFIVLPKSCPVSIGAFRLCAGELALEEKAGVLTFRQAENVAGQVFYLLPEGKNTYRLRSFQTGLDLTAAAPQAGARLSVQEAASDLCQLWHMTPVKNGWIFSLAQAPAVCLARSGSTLTTAALSKEQTFTLSACECTLGVGQPITFDLQGGQLPEAVSAAEVDKINLPADEEGLTLYTIPCQILTAADSVDIAVDADGRLAAVKAACAEDWLATPKSGFVLSGRGEAAAFVQSIAQMDGEACYVAYDAVSGRISVYDSAEGYSAACCRLVSGEIRGRMPEPVQEGKEFGGWYTEQAGGDRIITGSSCQTSQLYARWLDPVDKEHTHLWGEWSQINGQTDAHDQLTARFCQTCAAYETQPFDCPSLAFRDVNRAAWYHSYVDYALRENLFRGMSDTSFAPNLAANRAMLVTVLWRMEGSPETEAGNPFTDAKAGAYYYDAVRWAADCGVVNGVTETTFCPNEPITRQQAAAILFRLAGQKGYDVSARAELEGFDDVDKLHAYAVEPMAWANAVGVIQGTSATTLAPTANATRAQIAAILMRFTENTAVPVE